MEESNPELESFRQQWRAEVSAKSRTDESKQTYKTAQASRAPRRPPGSSSNIPLVLDDEEIEGNSSDELLTVSNEAGPSNDVEGFGGKFGAREPESALEHYEKAVEREGHGKLGDSLALYRKAFKMDHRVDVAYKDKHFPPSYFASKSVVPKSLPTIDVSTSIVQPVSTEPIKAQTINELIAGFTGLQIEPAPAEIEGTPAPPCPIADIPDEILVHILTDLAVIDVASYARTAQVCKRLAFLVATEEQPWKRVCLGTEVGFGAMHYEWQTEIEGGPVEGPPEDELPHEADPSHTEVENQPSANTAVVANALLKSVYSSSWRQMFRTRPRIRFNGCYISVVNYIRPGQASTNQLTWDSPVHVVTYYRYLRFFRDGTLLSLCTVSEPNEVIPYLTKDFRENKIKVKVDPALALPASVMNSAHRGRWRLSSAADHPDAAPKDAEGDVFVETEGVGHKYIYRMELTLRSAGKTARNNKLAWKAYWHYNKLTDDWGEFGLKNDKAFFWSRVKSWGMGE